jgi:hypothetical protein
METYNLKIILILKLFVKILNIKLTNAKIIICTSLVCRLPGYENRIQTTSANAVGAPKIEGLWGASRFAHWGQNSPDRFLIGGYRGLFISGYKFTSTPVHLHGVMLKHIDTFYNFTITISDVIYDLYNYSAGVGYIESMLINCI